MEKGTIGLRIKAQRESLGFSQAQIAEKTGITARSQRNYETGKRIPDAEYLAAIAPLGIDINYVLNGDKAYAWSHPTTPTEEWHPFVVIMQMAFGISISDVMKIRDSALVDDDLFSIDPAVFFSEMLIVSNVFRLLADKYAEFDQSLLTLVLQGIDDAINKYSLHLTAAKKAQATAMLYRTFKGSSKLDQAIIEDTVKLAAS